MSQWLSRNRIEYERNQDDRPNVNGDEQFFVLGARIEVSVEEREEALHLSVEQLQSNEAISETAGCSDDFEPKSRLTVFSSGFSTLETSLLSSLRMALDATPVVALLKSYEVGN